MPKHLPTLYRSRGFTLIELVVVVGIIVMILGVSAPILSSLSQQRSLTGSGDAIQVQMMKFRQQAASTGAPVFVVLEHWTNPMRLVSWGAEYNEQYGRWSMYPISLTVLPETVWIDEVWMNEHVDDYKNDAVITADYSEILGELMNQPAGGGIEGNDRQRGITTTYNFTDGNGFAGDAVIEFDPSTDDDDLQVFPSKPIVWVINPDGTVAIIGKENIASQHILLPEDIDEERNPNNNDADLVIRNADERLWMDINPMTGRIEYIKRDAALLE